MKYKLFLSSLFYLLSFSSFAQLNIDWAADFQGSCCLGINEGYSIAADNAGNVYTTGYFEDTIDFDPGSGVYKLISKGYYDIFLSKLDPAGNFLWAIQIGGLYEDTGLSLAVDAAGNSYITGYFSDTVDFDPGPGISEFYSQGWLNHDIFICKISTTGNLQWVKHFEEGSGGDSGDGITLDASGNVYMTGTYSGTLFIDATSITGGNIFVSKFNSSGTLLWAKTFEGGGSFNHAYSIAVDPALNVYTTGTFSNTQDFDPGPGTYNLTNPWGYYGDIYISKLDPLGNFVWAKRIGESDIDHSYSISADQVGNVSVTGMFQDSIDLDPGAGINMHYTASSGVTDYFLLRLNSYGDFAWGKSYSASAGSTIGNAVLTDSLFNTYSLGVFWGTVDFDPDTATYNITSAGDFDTFINKFDSWGNLIWAKTFGGTNRDFGQRLSMKNGKMFATGYFFGNCDFDPDTSSYLVTSSPYVFDIFSVQFNCPVVTGVQEIQTNNNLLIYPNPNDGLFSLQLESKENAKIQINIFSITGQLINSFGDQKLNIGENKLQINTSDLANGIYFLETKIENQTKTLKFVVNK